MLGHLSTSVGRIALLLVSIVALEPASCAADIVDSYTNSEMRSNWKTVSGQPSLLVGHRGERAFSLPEHSLPGYHMAVWEHADFVEPDLVMTQDHHIVCYHDLSLKSNTDVASRPEFLNRKRNLTVPDIPGNAGNLVLEDDWFIMDFTLQELKSLRLNVIPRGKRNMRLPFFDGQFTIPTFDEYLDLIQNLTALTRRKIGIIPEIKHSSTHQLYLYPGQPYLFERMVLAKFREHGFLDELGRPSSRHGDIVIQTFEVDTARSLRQLNKHISILLLVFGNVEVLTPNGLANITSVVTHVGPYKSFYTVGPQTVIDHEFKNSSWLDRKQLEQLGGLLSAQELAPALHKHNLKQMPFTFYSSYEFNDDIDPNSHVFFPGLGGGQLSLRRTELFYFFGLGMDGLFVENINEALLLREEFMGFVTENGESSFAQFRIEFNSTHRDGDWVSQLRESLVSRYFLEHKI